MDPKPNTFEWKVLLITNSLFFKFLFSYFKVACREIHTKRIKFSFLISFSTFQSMLCFQQPLAVWICDCERKHQDWCQPSDCCVQTPERIRCREKSCSGAHCVCARGWRMVSTSTYNLPTYLLTAPYICVRQGKL